jgi:hypothetical protein
MHKSFSRAAFVLAICCLSCTAASSAEFEFATVLLMRHGEKSEGSGAALSPEGVARAIYIGRCLGSGALTTATPSPITTVMACATRANKSHRSIDTLRPLAAALGLTIDSAVDKADPAGLELAARDKLRAGGTLVIAWQHEELPGVIHAFAKKLRLHHAFREWPSTCDAAEWAEPSDLKGYGQCYDLVWQLIMRRRPGETLWEAAEASQLHMGFGGLPESPCTGAFAPLAFEADMSRGRLRKVE